MISVVRPVNVYANEQYHPNPGICKSGRMALGLDFTSVNKLFCIAVAVAGYMCMCVCVCTYVRVCVRVCN